MKYFKHTEKKSQKSMCCSDLMKHVPGRDMNRIPVQGLSLYHKREGALGQRKELWSSTLKDLLEWTGVPVQALLPNSSES